MDEIEPSRNWLPAIGALLFGILLGYQLDIARMPTVLVLGKTDGALCFAQTSRLGDASIGPHWLVRADGICYAEDMPR